MSEQFTAAVLSVRVRDSLELSARHLDMRITLAVVISTLTGTNVPLHVRTHESATSANIEQLELGANAAPRFWAR